MGEKPLLTDKDRLRIAEVRRMLKDGESPFSWFSEQTVKRIKVDPTVIAERKALQEAEMERKAESRIKRFQTHPTSKVIVVKPAEPRMVEENVVRCVRCQVEVDPGLSYRARVYTGHIKINVEKSKLVSLNPVEYEEFTEKLPVPKFSTGFVCDQCAADYGYETIETRKGIEVIPKVVTLPRVEMKVPEERTPFQRRGFSTRIKVSGAPKAHYRDNYFEK